MIQVTILRDREKLVKGIEINGHAGYAEYGQDVICAAVSALALNMANSVEAFTDDSLRAVQQKTAEALHFPFQVKSAPSHSSS